MTTDLTINDDRLHKLEGITFNIEGLLYLVDSQEQTLNNYAARVVRAAEGFIAEPDVQNLVEGDIRVIQREANELIQTVRELTTLLIGTVELARAFRDQRNDLLERLHTSPQQEQINFWEAFEQRLVEVQGCTPYQAKLMVYLLSNDDSQVMADDVAGSLTQVETFREGVKKLLDEWGQS